MKAEEKKKYEEQLFVEKDKEIARKEGALKLLSKKSERIELKKQSIIKYEKYLQLVREQNPDEFSEINDILSRYYTLEAKKKDLDGENQKQEEKLEAIKERISKYKKDGEE